MHDSILNMECDHLRKHFVFTYDISRYNENLMFASAQLRIPIVCLRAWQFGQSVKPKVNISPLSPSAQCLSLALAPSEPSGGPSNHPRTIPWPAPSLLLGQHWTQFRKVRPSGHFSEADRCKTDQVWSYHCDCFKWRRNEMICWRKRTQYRHKMISKRSSQMKWFEFNEKEQMDGKMFAKTISVL